MKHYLESISQLLFEVTFFGCASVLMLATLADFFGWYDREGRYRGPLSKLFSRKPLKK